MNDEFPDYYEVLNVPFDASRDEIRRAFREAALYWHPDRNRGNEAAANEMMGLVNEAWEVLGTPEVRVEYDQAWMAWMELYYATEEEDIYPEWEEYRQYPEWEEFTQTPSFFSKLWGAIRWFSEMVRRTPIWVQILIWLLVVAFIVGISAGIVWMVIEIVKLVVEVVKFIVELVRIIVGFVIVIAVALGLLWVALQMSNDER